MVVFPTRLAPSIRAAVFPADSVFQESNVSYIFRLNMVLPPFLRSDTIWVWSKFQLEKSKITAKLRLARRGYTTKFQFVKKGGGQIGRWTNKRHDYRMTQLICDRHGGFFFFWSCDIMMTVRKVYSRNRVICF